MRALLAAIDHGRSHAEVLAERALLAGLGGSCQSPIAALTQWAGETIVLRAAIYSSDGAVRIADETRLAPGDQGPPQQLARDLLAQAPPHVAGSFSGES